MTSWVLVLYIYAGVWAKGDSVALHTITGFTSKQTCEAAGQAPSSLVSGSAKDYRYVCVEVK